MRSLYLTIVFGMSLAMTMPSQASPLYAISGDANGVPRQVSTFAPAGPATPLFTLGDGSLGFTGGLAYSSTAGAFFTIASDGQGASTLYSFDLAGTLTSLFALGDGFFGGLAWDSDNGYLYAAQNDSDGNSSIYRLDTVGHSSTFLFAMREGLTGGLTYNKTDGFLYGIVNDFQGNSTLMQINLAGATAAGVTPPLGTGFLGGVAYDPTSGGFFAINSDMLGGSNLNAIVTGVGGSVTHGAALGDGYAAAGLTFGPDTPGSAVPEPGTALMAVVGLSLVGLSRRLKKN